MEPGREWEPPAYDDLDDLAYRRPRWVTDDRAVIRNIRRILEEQRVPPEQRQLLATAFYDDWVETEANAWQRWLNRCEGRAHAM